MNFNEEMERESRRNTKSGLPCSNSLVEQAVKMRQKLTGDYYRLVELRRIYIKTSVADNFKMDNISQCDTGSVQTDLIKRKRLKKF